jgi:calcium/calmodulin-dependent 3',5'-cyclic nucleotide phosphodiesterase
LGIPFSPLCDRNNTPVAQSQIGFINFIVEPSFVVLGDMMEKIVEQILTLEETKSEMSQKSNDGSDLTDTCKSSSLSEKM